MLRKNNIGLVTLKEKFRILSPQDPLQLTTLVKYIALEKIKKF